MDIQIATTDKGSKVTLSGQFTFMDNQKFKEVIEIGRGDQVKYLELDFAAVEFIDSAGLGMLLLLREECQDRNISLSIHSARGQVAKIFAISRFEQLFSMAK